jgi:Uma2 family endonuclease
MPLLQNASVEQLRRLLEFFPSSTLKTEWPGLKGQKKGTVCEMIATMKDTDRIKTFLMQNLGIIYLTPVA